MGRAGLIFEPHPWNLQNQHKFWRCFNVITKIFWYLCKFRICKKSLKQRSPCMKNSLANSSCDSHFHNGAFLYHKMGWLQYIWQFTHLTFPQLMNIFQNDCENVASTVTTPFYDNGTPRHENRNHSTVTLLAQI